MIYRPEIRAALFALALALTGCGDSEEDAAPTRPVIVSAQFGRLLADAERAIADGALDEAAQKLDEARSLSSESPDLWVAIARLRLRGGEHLSALEAADRALAFGPDHAPALRLRALMVRDSHGAAASFRWFAAARDADPENADILADYAATLGDAGRAEAMLTMVRALAEVAPDDPRVPWLQAVLAARGGEYGLARSLLTRSGLAERGVPAALLLDALINLQEGNADSAAATLETLVARQPANARFRELLARAMLESERYDAVIERFGAQADWPEASPYLMMVVARALEGRGDRAAAAPLLARAMRPMTGRPVVLALREGLPPPTADVRGALLAGNRAVARNQAEALRERFPASADVASLVGDALTGAGDPQAGLAAYNLAAEVRRPWPLTRRMVAAYHRIGNHEAADFMLLRHVDGETQTATALLALARRLAQAEDWARTARVLDHAIALGAGHDPELLGLRLRAARSLGQGKDAQAFAALLAAVRPRSLSGR